MLGRKETLSSMYGARIVYDMNDEKERHKKNRAFVESHKSSRKQGMRKGKRK